MNLKALYKISYGLYIITSRKGDLINGQIANSVFQISNELRLPSINKKNLTREFIKEVNCWRYLFWPWMLPCL